MLRNKITRSGANTIGGGSSGYVDDVFSTYVYKGNGSTQTITNGIDLDGEGGMVWIKNRDQPDNHKLVDTVRGATKELSSNLINNEATNADGLTALNADGFSLGADVEYNTNGEDYVSWTFRKQPGFFDIVTYTGTETQGQIVPHNLGSVPGCIIIKSLATGSWAVYHRSSDANPEDGYLLLNTSAGFAPSNYLNNTLPTATNFTLGLGIHTNQVGVEYVAYLFAHDDQRFGSNDDESIIKCGSYTGNGSDTAGPEIDLGWEPQWLLIKSSSAVYDWYIIDNIRGCIVGGVGGDDSYLRPNTTDTESSNGNASVDLAATGFQVNTNKPNVNNSGVNYIYIAIRRPHKPASEFDATDLFAIDGNVSQSNPAFRTGSWPVDMAFYRDASIVVQAQLSARLIQGKRLRTDNTDAETASGFFEFDYAEGWGTGAAAANVYSWMWRRAPEFFDVVCYTGDGVAGRTVEHNLGVVPEMIWLKGRDGSTSWLVYNKTITATDYLVLNTTAATAADSTVWNNTAPTGSVFTVGTSSNVNNSGASFIAFLFASVPGICDIGTYTGNGTNQIIDCGFTGGARFVLIKRTDVPGNNWNYFDTTRLSGTGNDSRLELNSTDAEDTGDDHIDPDSSGFKVNSTGPTSEDGNISGATYIYMAIA